MSPGDLDFGIRLPLTKWYSKIQVLMHWKMLNHKKTLNLMDNSSERKDVICTNSFHFLCHIECFSDILIIISLKEEFDSKGHLMDLLAAKKFFLPLNTMRWWLSLWRFTVRWWDGSHETFLGVLLNIIFKQPFPK